jgi:hypothetical protein
MMSISNYPSGIECEAFDDTGLAVQPERLLLFLAYVRGKAGRALIDKIVACIDHDGSLTATTSNALHDDEACLVSDSWHALGGDDYMAFVTDETVA